MKLSIKFRNLIIAFYCLCVFYYNLKYSDSLGRPKNPLNYGIVETLNKFLNEIIIPYLSRSQSSAFICFIPLCEISG